MSNRKKQRVRISDLIDVTLLISRGNLNLEMVVKALKITFVKRKTHDLPEKLIPPPKECGSVKGF